MNNTTLITLAMASAISAKSAQWDFPSFALGSGNHRKPLAAKPFLNQRQKRKNTRRAIAAGFNK